MKYISLKTLAMFLLIAGNQSIFATTDNDIETTQKTTMEYLLECPECKDATELLEIEECEEIIIELEKDKPQRGNCCNKCDNCSNCTTCSSCCKKGESNDLVSSKEEISKDLVREEQKNRKYVNRQLGEASPRSIRRS